MTDWQPIETAPRKTRVLVADKWKDVHIARLHSDGYWQSLSETDRDGEPTTVEPTYWMPLPEAPSEHPL